MLSIDMIGIILTLIFGIPAVLALILKLKRSAEEKAEKDMEIIYEPLLDEISKLIERENLLSSSYSQYVDCYKDIRRRGKVNPKPHRKLKKDMDDLVKRIEEEGEAFKTLRDKLLPLYEQKLEDIPVILKSGEKESYYSITHHYFIDVIWGLKEKWVNAFNEEVKKIKAREDVDKIDLLMSGRQLFDYFSSQVKNEREKCLDIRNEIFTKAKEIRKKLDYKARYPLKKYGGQLS